MGQPDRVARVILATSKSGIRTKVDKGGGV